MRPITVRPILYSTEAMYWDGRDTPEFRAAAARWLPTEYALRPLPGNPKARQLGVSAWVWLPGSWLVRTPFGHPHSGSTLWGYECLREDEFESRYEGGA